MLRGLARLRERLDASALISFNQRNRDGGFFRHLLQELARAVHIIHVNHPRPRWHPFRWASIIGLHVLASRWLTRLDDEIPIPEFTVGYHVHARKRDDERA